MPTALETFITNGYNDGGSALAALANARNHIHNLGTQIAANNWAEAAVQCTGASDDIGYFLRYAYQSDVFYKGMRYDWKEALMWINDNWPSGAEVTMSGILAAMQSASFEELTSFMGITQAYKVAVWDAPFNEEFYAALARGFKTWGA